MQADYPTVKLTDLIKDGCNYQDETFEKFVRGFMNRNMPSFPLGLLDTDGPDSFERWEIEPEERFTVVEVQATVFVCTECGEEYTPDKAQEMGGVCCPLESLGAQEDEDPDEEYEPLEEENRHFCGVQDTHYAGVVFTNQGPTLYELPDQEPVWGWDIDDEQDAEQKAEELNREYANEGRHGFPWANSWCFMPDDVISTDDLKAAGFTVAQYIGGEGRWHSDERYRLAGVDGGGYSFQAHYSRLVALHFSGKGWPVQTDNGEAYIEVE